MFQNRIVRCFIVPWLRQSVCLSMPAFHHRTCLLMRLPVSVFIKLQEYLFLNDKHIMHFEIKIRSPFSTAICYFKWADFGFCHALLIPRIMSASVISALRPRPFLSLPFRAFSLPPSLNFPCTAAHLGRWCPIYLQCIHLNYYQPSKREFRLDKYSYFNSTLTQDTF